LIEWQGKPFVAHVSDRLASQVAEIIISCNRNFSRYSKYGSCTVADTRRDFQGPLAGIEAAASVIRTELLVVVSCDTPLLPEDLVTRLVTPLADYTAADISYAFDGVRAQYLCAAMRSACLESLPAFLDDGQRAVKDWYSSRNAVAVDFSDQQASFKNYNTLAHNDI
jgi:molybdenum cofactor guanylyltransferase